MMITRKRLGKVILAFFLVSQFWGLSLFFPKELSSANLTDVSDSLSNNRLSFRGELEGNVSAGGAVINLDTTPEDSANTSTGSASLMVNESLQVGGDNPAVAIKTIDSSTRVVLSSGLTNAASDGVLVVATSSAVHTVSFTPVSVIDGGAFRVLIPAASAGANDGYPDKTGFDFTTSTPTVSCTGGGGNMTFETGTASASAVTIGSVDYHSFECRYTGTGASPGAATMSIGTPAGAKLINPSPSSTTRYPGEADTYTFRVRHLYGPTQSYATVDETLGKIGVVEAVRVTATVSPTLTFQITGRAANSTSCGKTTPTDVGTTYNSVPFGTSVSVTSFADLAQQLLVSTNAAAGYVVTASESAALTAYNISGTPTIPNTTCDSTTCAYTDASGSEWNTTTSKGFGYSLQDVAGDCVAAGLEYNNGGATFNARPFGTVGQSIMTASAPVDSDMAYVCYRIIVSGTQQAGDYENYVIYIATATF